MATEQTLEVVRSYYECWQGGKPVDEARLRTVLHPRLVFESPAGRKEQLEDFMPGLLRYAGTLKARHMLQLFAVGDEAAAIYDCDLTPPINNLRCAEFFRVEGRQITAIRLVFDATPYNVKP